MRGWYYSWIGNWISVWVWTVVPDPFVGICSTKHCLLKMFAKLQNVNSPQYRDVVVWTSIMFMKCIKLSHRLHFNLRGNEVEIECSIKLFVNVCFIFRYRRKFGVCSLTEICKISRTWVPLYVILFSIEFTVLNSNKSPPFHKSEYKLPLSPDAWRITLTQIDDSPQNKDIAKFCSSRISIIICSACGLKHTAKSFKSITIANWIPKLVVATLTSAPPRNTFIRQIGFDLLSLANVMAGSVRANQRKPLTFVNHRRKCRYPGEEVKDFIPISASHEK